MQGSAAAVWTCDFQQHSPAVLYMYLKINSSSNPTSVFFFFFLFQLSCYVMCSGQLQYSDLILLNIAATLRSIFSIMVTVMNTVICSVRYERDLLVLIKETSRTAEVGEEERRK